MVDLQRHNVYEIVLRYGFIYPRGQLAALKTSVKHLQICNIVTSRAVSLLCSSDNTASFRVEALPFNVSLLLLHQYPLSQLTV